MIQNRLRIINFILLLLMSAVLVRLFYWQVIASEELTSLGEKQHFSEVEISAKRGEILSSDGYPLVTNKDTFLVYAYLPQLTKPVPEVVNLLVPIFSSNFKQESTTSASIDYQSPIQMGKSVLEEKLRREDVLWVPLVRNTDLNQKKAVENLKIEGIGIEPSFERDYPEASMAASLLGFVGSDTTGNMKGYFGLEGYYDLELKGRPGILRQEKDASGKPILIGEYDELQSIEGRNLILHTDRAVQRIAQEKLKKGLEKYGAVSGEVIIVDPKSGGVLGLATLPSYDPANFNKYDANLYKNPAVSESYEPGSTFKVLTMSAALDEKAVTPETKCDICDGPLRIGGYVIRTWNNEYNPQSTIKEVIQHSDNIGMVFTAKKLGKEKLFKYLTRFGIGEKTGIDLQEESTPNLRPLKDWKEIDLATASFGQGVAVTGMQMVRAVSAIANDGIMLVPKVVQKVVGDTTIEIKNQDKIRVVSQETARMMTEMMVNAVENGEAKWAKPKGYKIAGKTGTSQIPVAGHYDQEKTIASFIGFAPADDPKFVMLVKLREPQSSPWGSETAAPLWFSISEDLLFYYGIQPKE